MAKVRVKIKAHKRKGRPVKSSVQYRPKHRKKPKKITPIRDKGLTVATINPKTGEFTGRKRVPTRQSDITHIRRSPDGRIFGRWSPSKEKLKKRKK